MNIQVTKSQIGLDGVPAAETALSHVDGERGELIIAGEHVADLAGKSSFEGATARLWNGASGKTLSEANVRASLGAAHQRAFARLADLLPATHGMSIVDGFRAAVAGLRAENGLGGVDSKDSLLGANQIQGCFWGGSLGCDGPFGFERCGMGPDGASYYRAT